MAEIMAQKEYSIFEVARNLAGACILSGAIIAGTYYITSPTAERKAAEMKQNTMKSLIRQADTVKQIPGRTDWYEALKGGKTIAYVVPAEAKGYGGTIEMLAGIGTDGKVLDFSILSSNETPGLGQNASKESFRSQFEGKSLKNLVVVKDPSDKEDIQAMTGATISSSAVTEGIREAVEKVRELEKFTAKGGK